MTTIQVPDWFLIAAGVVLVFILGITYGRGNHRINIPRILIGILASICSLYALLGGLLFVSPTLFSKIASSIPKPIGDVIGQDWLARWMLFGDMTGFIIFLVAAALLWWWYERLG